MKRITLDEKDAIIYSNGNKWEFFALKMVPFIGLTLSGVLACLSINYIELLEVFIENIDNSEVLHEISPITKRWYCINIFMFVIGLLVLFLYSLYEKKYKGKSDFTWKEVVVIAVSLILILQIVLPLFSFILAITITLLYLIFYVSLMLKNVIGFGVYFCALIIDKVCNSSGVTLPYDKFIEQKDYTMLLTLITMLILVPYVLSNSLKLIRKVIQWATGNMSIGLLFKPVEVIFSVNILRYVLYIVLFFLSIFLFSVKISEEDLFFALVKEALLEFVILDTIIYSIVSKLNSICIERKRKSRRKRYTPFKYDLEFVLATISMNGLTDKEIYGRILFTEDVNMIMKKHNTKDEEEINYLLIDLSTNTFSMEILQEKIKCVLGKIIDLIE